MRGGGGRECCTAAPTSCDFFYAVIMKILIFFIFYPRSTLFLGFTESLAGQFWAIFANTKLRELVIVKCNERNEKRACSRATLLPTTGGSVA